MHMTPRQQEIADASMRSCGITEFSAYQLLAAGTP